MKKHLLKCLALLFFFMMTAAMLCFAPLSLQLALEGLNLWFQKMIPALLPFMILSNLLLGLGLSDSFAACFAPLLRPFFRLSDSCLYCIVVGFFCGFPMGAKVCAQSYERGLISRREATLLLSFCNNIGPVYFTGYVLQLFPVKSPYLPLLGMYGLPLLYGILLRHSYFRDIPARYKATCKTGSSALCAAENTVPSDSRSVRAANRFLGQLNTSILNALDAVTVLGGYMIFGNLLNLLPWIFLRKLPGLRTFFGPLLEITSGIARLPASQSRLAFILLPFGGFSCIAQTYNCIKNTDLSLSGYICHKLLQTLLTAVFYLIFPTIL